MIRRLAVVLVNALAWTAERAICAFPNLTDSDDKDNPR